MLGQAGHAFLGCAAVDGAVAVAIGFLETLLGVRAPLSLAFLGIGLALLATLLHFRPHFLALLRVFLAALAHARLHLLAALPGVGRAALEQGIALGGGRPAPALGTYRGAGQTLCRRRRGISSEQRERTQGGG